MGHGYIRNKIMDNETKNQLAEAYSSYEESIVKILGKFSDQEVLDYSGFTADTVPIFDEDMIPKRIAFYEVVYRKVLCKFDEAISLPGSSGNY